MARTTDKILKQAQAWIDLKESDGSHKVIIDTYNAHRPLARGYKVKYTDAWCATFISALSIKCGYTNIIPTECSCSRMIDLFKSIGKFIENENCIPSPGWIIFYDWGDSGKGDNKGNPDHVGIVEKVEGGIITVIEGNYSNAVKRRKVFVNDRYIRGYASPEYEAEAQTQEKPSIPHVKATEPAKSHNKELNKWFTTTTDLWMRHGAGTTKNKMVMIPKGTKVRCYGYYSSYYWVKWLYIQVTLGGVKYTGFSSSRYLE